MAVNLTFPLFKYLFPFNFSGKKKAPTPNRLVRREKEELRSAFTISLNLCLQSFYRIISQQRLYLNDCRLIKLQQPLLLRQSHANKFRIDTFHIC